MKKSYLDIKILAFCRLNDNKVKLECSTNTRLWKSQINKCRFRYYWNRLRKPDPYLPNQIKLFTFFIHSNLFLDTKEKNNERLEIWAPTCTYCLLLLTTL